MKPLAPFPFQTPGVYGLNLQGRNTILGPEWATRALDLVIDDQGRLANRLGYKAQASDKTALGGLTIQSVHVGLTSAGVRTNYCATTDGKIHELVSGVWTTRYSTPLPSTGDWQFANFNSKVLALHEDGYLLVQSAPGAAFVAITPTSGNLPSGRALLAAFGRVWVLAADKLYYSNLLDETDWDEAGAVAGGNAYFELRYMWPNGYDVSVGMAEFNGRLVVFGEENILFITNTWDVDLTSTGAVSGATLEDTLQNVGCIERNTITSVGADIMFLSRIGVQSLGRVIQERSAPITDLVPQVRDHIQLEYDASGGVVVQAAYTANYGLYVLAFARVTIVIDTRVKLPNGTYRVTEWQPMGAVHGDGYGGLYVSHGDEFEKYQGYYDSVAFGDATGDYIAGDYESGWQDWEAVAPGSSSINKFLKRVKMYIAGGANGTLTLKWYVDYSEQATTASVVIPDAPNAANYNEATYNTTYVYGSSLDITELSKPGRKGGRVIKVGCKIDSTTSDFAINQMSLYATTGKQAH